MAQKADDGEDLSSAMVVNSTDFHNVMLETDMKESSVQELSDNINSSTENHEEEDDEEDEEDDAANDDKIRNATNKYLEGSLTLADFAAALEDCSDSSVRNENLGDDATSLSPPKTARLVLLKSDVMTTEDESRGSLALDSTVTPPIPPDDDSTWQTKPRWNADFYSSGDKVATFTLRRRRKMSPTVQGMMGEANLRFARGNNQSAIDICLEIIKEQPTFVEPFNTLSMIYESMGNLEKSLQYALIAGYLDPKHCNDWPKLAEMSFDMGNIQQAIMCYSKSITVEPTAANLYLRRAELQLQVGDNKGAIKSYLRLVQALPTSSSACIQAYRKIAEYYHHKGEIDKAYEMMQLAFKEHPNEINNGEVNLILELSISIKKYVEAVEVLQQFSKLSFEPELEEADYETRESLSSSLSKRTAVVVPSNFPIDINAKLIIILIHLGAFDLSQSLLKSLTTRPVESFGDLYLDVAEAYMAKSRCDLALELLILLVKSAAFGQAAVWLRYAECLYLLKKYEEAAAAYEKVVSLAPKHNVAKLNLSLILQKLGRSEDALLSLNQEIDQEEERIDHYLVVEKCNIYIRQQMLYELIETAQYLFQRHCQNFRSKEDALGVITSYPAKRFESVQNNRLKRGEHPDDKRPNFIDKPSKIEAEWKIYLSVCQVCLDMERYDLLERFTYTAWSSELFGQDSQMEKCCRLHCYLSTLLNMDQDLLAPHVKAQSVVSAESSTPMLRNLFAKAIQRYDYVRYGRNLSRLISKTPEDNDLLLLRAHHNFSCGNYKTALTQYFQLHSVTPDNPLLSLMIATCFLSILSQKTTTNRSYLAVQVMAFMHNYVKVRGECQESFYNMARALHLLGMYQQALSYYNRALEMSPIAASYSKQKATFFGEERLLDLRNDILFNLAKLYDTTGATHVARSYLSQIRV